METGPLRPGRTTTRPLVAALVVALTALVALLGLGGTASAHTSLVDSDPEANGTLTESPGSVTLVFDETPSDFAATVVLTAPDGSTLTGRDVRVDGRELTVTIDPLTAPGRYRVAYRVVSADGHPVTGQYGFSFDPPAATTSSSAGATTPASVGSSAAPSVPASSAVPSSTGSGSLSATPGPSTPGPSSSQAPGTTSSAAVSPSSDPSSDPSAAPSSGPAASGAMTDEGTSGAATTGATTSGSALPQPAPSGSSTSIWVLVGVAAVLVLGAVGAFLLARRHRLRQH